MMKSYRLKEIGKIVTGKTPLTKSIDNFGTDIPFITPRDMIDSRYIFSTERSLSNRGAETVYNSIIPKNSIVVSCIGSDMGKVAITTMQSVTNQQINSLMVNDKHDYLYVYYVLSTKKEELLSIAGGSALPILNKRDFENYEISLPPLETQKEIAHILGTLDDKIELNRRMNKTLEEIAQTLYKHWFIDFEFPNAEGKPYRSSGGEMIDSELGPVPKGWRVGKLGDVTDIIDCLHSKKPERKESGFPLLQLSNIRDDGHLDMSDTYFIDEIDYKKWISRIEVKQGDCVITNVGRVGAVSQIPEGFKAAMGRNMTAIRCKENFSYPTYIINFLLSESMDKELELNTDTGTILNALNVKNIPKIRIVLPVDSVIDQYEHLSKQQRGRMEVHSLTNCFLSTILSNLTEVMILANKYGVI